MTSSSSLRTFLLFAVCGLFFAACGDDDGQEISSPFGEQNAADETTPGSQDGSGDDSGSPAGTDDSDGQAGPAARDTIQIGGRVWRWTNASDVGQCFVEEATESLPVRVNAWGRLDEDDSVRFSVRILTEEAAEVQSDDYFWIAGDSSPGVNDLNFDLDFENNTIRGSGTFSNLHTGETAPGSFEFVCES